MKVKTIFITGAGSGLGKGAAIGLAKAGHNIIAAVHTWEQLSRFTKELANKDTRRNK